MSVFKKILAEENGLAKALKSEKNVKIGRFLSLIIFGSHIGNDFSDYKRYYIDFGFFNRKVYALQASSNILKLNDYIRKDI